MRKIISVALPFIAAVGLVACGGVDRDGSRDLFIEQAEAAGGTADGDCVDDVLADYSDDDLESFNELDMNGQIPEEAQAFFESLASCVSFGS